MATSVKWSFEADYLQGCNCDYGCPCEFEAPPTQGGCEGLGVYRITSGHCGDVKLDGLTIGFVIDFPKAMHLGNGVGGWIIDEKATPAQRNSLMTILSGEAGGMPFEILKVLISKPMDFQFAPAEFVLDGRNSRAKLGSAIDIAIEPIKNPVSGEAEQIRIEHGTGFIFKSAEVVAARTCTAKTPMINFNWPNKAGFVARIKYGN